MTNGEANDSLATMTIRLSTAFAAAIFAFTLLACARTYAQSASSVPNAMQGFVQNRDEPVQIEAAVLEMRDKKKEATFSGNVKVTQGDTTMTSKILVVFYDGSASGSSSPPAGAKPPPPGNKDAKGPPMPSATPPPTPTPMPSATPAPAGSTSSIKRLEARGNVVVTQRDQTVTGETAIFDTKTNLITMLGGVVLTQCNNVVRGDRLRVDMTTGVSKVESDSGRVSASVNQGKDCVTAPAGTIAPTPAPAPAKSK